MLSTSASPVRERVRVPSAASARRQWAPDLAVVGLYLLLAVWVMERVWRHAGRVDPASDPNDSQILEWALVHAGRIFTHGENPFFTPQLNAPLGVNEIANIGLLGLTVPLVPVTLLLGPSIALVLLMTVGLAGTAWAWYHVLSPHLVTGRLAAFVGGGFAGFAPGMVNHANGHPQMVAQFLIPFIVWQALELRNGGAFVRRGAVLGLLIAWQALIGEELLFDTALAIAIFIGCYALFRPREVVRSARPFVQGATVAALTAAALLSYPLWFQLFGPQHYRALPADWLGYLRADLSVYPAFAKLSLVRHGASVASFSPQPEENAFLGAPLLVAVAVLIAWLWRRSVSVRALSVVGLVFVVLSTGTVITYRGRVLLQHAPWYWLRHLPLLKFALPIRFSMVLIPVIAVLLAFSVDAAMGRRRTGPSDEPAVGADPVAAAEPATLAADLQAGSGTASPGGASADEAGRARAADTVAGQARDAGTGPIGPANGPAGTGVVTAAPLEVGSARRRTGRVLLGWAWLAVLAGVLIPIAPVPLPVIGRPAVPAFFTSGHWQRYVTGDESVLSADTLASHGAVQMSWDNATMQGYRMVGGYFVGPDQSGAGQVGPVPRPTAALLTGVALSGRQTDIGAAERAQLAADVRFWHAAIIVLAPGAPNPDALRGTLDRLVGPGLRVDDVWVWDVHTIG